jgi:HK97 family phage portal protein
MARQNLKDGVFMSKIVKRRTRTLADNPTDKLYEVENVKHLNADFDQDMSTGIWDQEIKAFMEATTLKGLFFSEDWVFMILDLIAESVASSPMVVKRTVGETDGKAEIETIDEHPALTLIKNPNEFQEYATFIYNYVIELDLMGNALLHYARNRQTLNIIPAENVSLKMDDKGGFAGYEIFQDMAFEEQLTGRGMFFTRQNVWHQRRPNPKSMLWGLSPFVPTRKNVLFNRYTSDWLNSFYLKGATPTVSLSMERNVDEKSALRFLRSFEQAYTGVRNMRRPLVLPKGVTAETMSPTVADQQLIELINKNRENIINILRVPKHALSLAESGSLGSEEHKQALRYFYTAAIMPTQNKIAEHFTRKMKASRLLEENEVLCFDNSEVEPLRDDMLKKAELSNSLLSIMSANEIRKDLWDKEPIEGGDSLQSAVQQQPFGFSAPAPRIERIPRRGLQNGFQQI